MSSIVKLAGGWVILNGLVVVALMCRRSRPEIRKSLSDWVLNRSSREHPVVRRRTQAPLRR